MKLGRSLGRYGVARGIRSAGGSYGTGRALSLLIVPWRKRTKAPRPKSGR